MTPTELTAERITELRQIIAEHEREFAIYRDYLISYHRENFVQRNRVYQALENKRNSAGRVVPSLDIFWCLFLLEQDALTDHRDGVRVGGG